MPFDSDFAPLLRTGGVNYHSIAAAAGRPTFHDLQAGLEETYPGPGNGRISHLEETHLQTYLGWGYD